MSKGSPFEWSDEERERAQTLINGDARQLQNQGKKNAIKIPAGLCQEWRRDLKTNQGLTPYRIAEECEFSRAAVERHATGGCTHDPDVVGVGVRYSKVAGTWISDYE